MDAVKTVRLILEYDSKTIDVYLSVKYNYWGFLKVPQESIH